jgi:echinoderm microtubule-associated protein-like 1/2
LVREQQTTQSVCFWFVAVGDIIAIGSQNGSVYLFRVSRDGFSYKKYNKIKGTHPLACMDWSVDSNYLQTVTTDFDLVYCKRNWVAGAL